MNVFHCDHCGHLVFFENTQCVSCGHRLAWLPDAGVMAALAPGDDGTWTRSVPEAQGHRYRLCANDVEHAICNWAVRADEPQALCRSCRLTHVIPDLGVPGNHRAWQVLEAAKRRLLQTLLALHCPVDSKEDDPRDGLAFEFLADPPDPDAGPMLTGHADGVITVNIAEADDVERERRRKQLHEPYRTVLGHFRHEIGHYYWDRLLRDSPRLAAFRECFGDERADYAQALDRYYEAGPVADWQAAYVSAYASAHPWEDWAETWAHYLHMADALETVAACGLALVPQRGDEPALDATRLAGALAGGSFDGLVESWFPLTYLLNNLNRGLGLADAYPFVLSSPVIEKLRFVHETIAALRPPPAG